MNSTNSMEDDLKARFALMGNTNDVIKWNELKKRIERSPPAISTSDRCRLMLKVANGEKLSATQWNQLVGATILNAPKDLAVALPRREREEIAQVLQMIIEGAKVVGRLGELANGAVVLVPDFTTGSQRLVVSTVPAALAYGLWLFADPNQEFGHALCRCQYSECQRFYLLKQAGPGAPSRSYCRQEHRKAGDREKARQRMQSRREGK